LDEGEGREKHRGIRVMVVPSEGGRSKENIGRRCSGRWWRSSGGSERRREKRRG
ncbi:hypothetical protein HAX54_023465, partial [Datura stramonium]|nr:hypothetical protein [Datura stramonium]